MEERIFVAPPEMRCYRTRGYFEGVTRELFGVGGGISERERRDAMPGLG